eukprot:TRINITY_DN2608_c0_g1_i5.p1 TRINITY_DN2608_c0_g1~~TRINITY_DN2608_c0_g1_i5.p1  ORF type:complete len:249 (+),score=78.33 TRINITY_DN2608_c0_g1_i5:799-1545(+)
MAPLLDIKGSLDPSKQPSSRARVVGLLEAVRQDKEIDAILKWEDEDKIQKTVEKGGEKIRHYAAQYTIPHNQDDIAEYLEDIFTSALLVYATTCFDPTDTSSSEIKLDFFLMHLLTSSLAVRTYLPYLPLPQAVLLLRAHCTSAIHYYISRGRPIMDIKRLQEYTPQSTIFKDQSWDELKRLATSPKVELHVSKVIRALYIASQMYPKGEHASLWRQAAVLTLDQMLGLGKDWSQQAEGFQQAWQEPL